MSLARAFGQSVGPGTVLALVGELGAGKTTFVQGLAAGLRIPDLRQVLSPTFTLVNEYGGGRLPLVHLDFYRLAGVEAGIALGLEEQTARQDAVVAVEWADRAPALIPNDAVWLRFAWQGRAGRSVSVTGTSRPSSRRRGPT